MAPERRSFKRETADQRQKALIQSTLRLIASGGPEAATVRTISEDAGVTQGLIRHYFSSKEELFLAAYEHHMTEMTNTTSGVLAADHPSAVEHLKAFIVAALTPPVVDAQAVSIWAGFIHMVQRDPAMRAIHEKTYYHFRDELQVLVASAWTEVGIEKSQTEHRAAAIACNALLDGLWLEGGALPDSFETGELANVGLSSLGAILNVNFSNVGQ
ncbi:TetR family transcriptional regulator [Amylibacter sp. SFDW26]|uniref:TetR/AcrR family transcriptional regulator n=1 Tax=Amylibacter sp. SFDW26 TaxID=2652722 RepID=UPI0012628B00|nr:TetR family transcriptional regulator C-terminal domain-containing protein [Amylibacter sp. SFDW26]KAB7614266.1 TetR family transcriptional regulator [Amylibacter sp. SFDW26]